MIARNSLFWALQEYWSNKTILILLSWHNSDKQLKKYKKKFKEQVETVPKQRQ